MRIYAFCRLVVSGVVLATSALFMDAESLEGGDTLPEFEAVDQFEKNYPMPDGTRYVAVSFTMGAGKKANKYFAEKGERFLPGHNAVFLSNIHGMPGLARVFAMPKMRKYPHRIMLADEEGLLDDFPQEDDKITVFKLNEIGVIEDIHFWDPKEDDGNPFSF